MSHPRPRLLSQPFLPGELLVEILLRLPVKALHQFRCVCKSWKTLISSPQFAKDHLRISISNSTTTHQQLAYFTDDNTLKFKTCSVQSLFENPSSTPETLSCILQAGRYRFIAGSCNGLLCYSDGCCFRLINPCTRFVSKRSPPMARLVAFPPNTHYGFGYDQVNDKYKVVTISVVGVKVHTFGTNSWTRLPNLPNNLKLDRKDMEGKLVSGTLNWLGLRRGRPVIFSFNLEKETYGQVLLPPRVDCNRFNCFALGVLSNRLCLSYTIGTNCVLWLMKKYGVQESWIKLKSISYEKFFVTRGIDPYETVAPLCISENGVILVESRDLQLFMYDPNIGTFDYPKINETARARQILRIYHGSLVSPDGIPAESS